MLTAHALLAWTALAIALVLVPGPDTILVAGNAARRGLRAGMATTMGIALGGVWYMALCGFGFLSLLNAVPSLFVAVKTAGAIYLAWLGFRLVRGAITPKDGEEKPVALGAPFRQGFLTTILNPKVAMFFLAALPQFVGTGPEAPLRGVLLVGIVYVVGFVWLVGIAAVASRAGGRIGQSRAMRWIEGAIGTAFVGLAGQLALSRN